MTVPNGPTRIDEKRTDSNDTPETFDVIVVGSGPGGAIVARELTRRGASVLILEQGERRPITGSARQALRELWSPGRGLHLTSGPVSIVQGVTLGGSSVYYFGTAWDPPFSRLERFGVDIRSEVDEVKRELPYTIPDGSELAPRASLALRSARSLGLDWAPLPKFFRQGAAASEPMGTYGTALVEDKWNARVFVDESLDGGAELGTGARVRRVLSSRGRATGVEYVYEGKRHVALSDKVVLSAGAIGSAQVLRASGISRAGHNFFYDPLIAVAGMVEGTGWQPEPPMMSGVHLADEGVMITDMDLPYWMFSSVFAAAGRLRSRRQHRNSLTLMVKIRDELSGHITDRGGVRRPLTAGDRQSLDHGKAVAGSILRNAGATRLARTGYVAAHPGGTAKIGDVVDPNLHSELDGLYVCDASVIPIPWGIPPTLTIVALAKRLAAHLAQEGSVRTTDVPLAATS